MKMSRLDWEGDCHGTTRGGDTCCLRGMGKQDVRYCTAGVAWENNEWFVVLLEGVGNQS